MLVSSKALDPSSQIIFDNVAKDAIAVVQVELPEAADMSLVLRVISERIAESLVLGERDRHRLCRGAVAHVRQTLQVKESVSRIIFGS